MRRIRAENLRQLDRIAQEQRATLSEAFPPEERLALPEAFAELIKAIALDPYDPILWNLKSGWCYYLGQYSESVESADRAIQLRPHRYSRPWIIKASSLWYLKRDTEALSYAREALKQAEESQGEFTDDIDRAHELIRLILTPRRTRHSRS